MLNFTPKINNLTKFENFLILKDRSLEENAVHDASLISTRISEVNGPLAFLMCSGVDYQEYKNREVVHVIPGTKRYLALHPRYFFASYEFNIIFQVCLILESGFRFFQYGLKNREYDVSPYAFSPYADLP